MTGASAILRPACGRQGTRPAARRGVREASGGAGDSRVEEGAGGVPREKRFYISYTLYADVLRHDLEHLAALTAAAPATRRWRSQRSLAQRLQGWVCSWYQLRVCPVCYLWREQEQLYLHALLEDWQEPELAQAFAASRGLCWRHTLHLVEQGGQHAHLQAVLAAQQVHLQRLQDELHEFIRQLDYRLARQPYGREADAWRRAVALYIGMRGG